MRVVRHADRRGNPPGPQARRPRKDRTAAARVGAAHGPDAQEDPRGLHPLPSGHPPRAPYRYHGVIAGEPRAGKLARGVRTGGRWKRTRLWRAPRQRPTGVEGRWGCGTAVISLGAVGHPKALPTIPRIPSGGRVATGLWSLMPSLTLSIITLRISSAPDGNPPCPCVRKGGEDTGAGICGLSVAPSLMFPN